MKLIIPAIAFMSPARIRDPPLSYCHNRRCPFWDMRQDLPRHCSDATIGYLTRGINALITSWAGTFDAYHASESSSPMLWTFGIWPF